MVVVLTYWLSYEYVKNPRKALEPESAGPALLRGAFHVLTLLAPYLDEDGRQHLHALASRYLAPHLRRPRMAKWTAFPYAADAYTYDIRRPEEEVGAAAHRRCRAAAEGRVGARRLGPVPRRPVPEGDRGRA